MRNKNLVPSIMIRAVAVAAFVLCFVLPVVALAQDAAASFPIPEGDVSALLLKLATSYKTLGVLGGLVIAVLVTVQALHAWLPDNWKWKRLTVLAVSIVYSILSGIAMPGANVASVMVTVFISGGGASALYEALKGAGVIKTG